MFDRSASFCLVFDKIGCCATSAELLEFNKTGVNDCDDDQMMTD